MDSNNQIKVEWARAEDLTEQGKLHEAATCLFRVKRLLLQESGTDGGQKFGLVLKQLNAKAVAEFEKVLGMIKAASPYVALGLDGVSTCETIFMLSLQITNPIYTQPPHITSGRGEEGLPQDGAQVSPRPQP
jgi:hypothetical protein